MVRWFRILWATFWTVWSGWWGDLRLLAKNGAFPQSQAIWSCLQTFGYGSCHAIRIYRPYPTKFTKTKIWPKRPQLLKKLQSKYQRKTRHKRYTRRVFKKQQIRKIKNQKRKRNFSFPALTDWHKCPFGYQWSPTDSLNNGVGLIFEKEKS